MDTDTNSPALVAKAVIQLRATRRWTQENLADEANVTLRTVQRVEAGSSTNEVTRRALARAFGVDGGFFCQPAGDPVEAQAKAEAALAEFEKAWFPLPVMPATGRDIMRMLVNTDRYRALMSGPAGRPPRDVDDIIAHVSDFLSDVLDVAEHMRQADVLEYGDRLDEWNAQIRERGWHLILGWRDEMAGRLPMRAVYVFGSRIEADHETILVERELRIIA